ncbi:hypothetical protein WJX82_007329 [Trebouxia sp. C0006]
MEACRVSHLEDFDWEGYLDAGSNYDLDVILHIPVLGLSAHVYKSLHALGLATIALGVTGFAPIERQPG